MSRLWVVVVALVGVLTTGCGAPWPQVIITGSPTDQPAASRPATPHGPAAVPRAAAAHGTAEQVPEENLPAVETPALPPADWADPPPCRNEPQGLAAWQAELAGRTHSAATASRFGAYLAQLRRYSPRFHDLSVDHLADGLATLDAAAAEDVRERTLTVLWLNLISGRLNRATGIEALDAAGPNTVAALIDELEQAETDSARFKQLLAAADEVNIGQRIRVPVCAHLVYRTEMLIRETFWSTEGFFNRDLSLVDVPEGVTAFSPDHNCIVVACPRTDSAGGPLYLMNRQTETLLNLNLHIGLPDYTGVSSLEVEAWHFDNRHLLLVNEDDEVFVWLDSETGEFAPLLLGVDTSRQSPPREIALAPDGSGFTFITVDRGTDTTSLHWYDLATHTPSMLTTLPVGRGSVTDFAISPTSDQATYLVRRGTHKRGYSQELHLIDLDDFRTRVLLSANLGSGGAVWSPDGEHIAFIRKQPDRQSHSSPSAEPESGDVWMLSIGTGEIVQLTAIGAVRQPPVWSPDGQHLVLVTSDGKIGMIATDQPEQVWQIEADPVVPYLTTIALVP